MSKKRARKSIEGVARVLIICEKPQNLSRAKKVLRESSKKRGGKLEIMSCDSLDAARDFLTYYLNGILLFFPDASGPALMSQMKKLRRDYSGRIGLVNNDPSVQPYTWGRVGGVDFHATEIEKADEFVDMLFAPRLGRGKTAILLEAGGILGGFMEFGALRALYAFGIRDFDIYMGISAGSFVAACAANQIPFRMMLERNIISAEDIGFNTLLSYRIVLHICNTIYRKRGDTGDIVSDSINSIFHLGQKYAEPGNFYATQDVFSFIPKGLSDYFVPAGIYEGRKIMQMRTIE